MKHLLLTLLLAQSALAETATLAWDANPEPDIAGYEISYGTDAGKLDTKVPVGKITEHRLTDLVPGVKYYLEIRAKSELGGISSPSDVISYTVPKLNPQGWTVKFTDSEEFNGFASQLAIDGDPTTFWHTKWRDEKEITPLPHDIQIDMQAEKSIGGFTYLPRQDEFSIGNIKAYDFYTSQDGIAWGEPASSGEIAPGKQLSTILFQPRLARYFKLVAKSNHDGTQVACAAELGVIEAVPIIPPSKPNTPHLIRSVEIQTSSNLQVWKTVAFIPVQKPTEFVRARISTVTTP